MIEPEKIISIFNLQPHPEGGHFSEIYRSKNVIDTVYGQRNLCTSIYYLLKGNQVSLFHRLKSDELWFYHYGTTLNIYLVEDKKLNCYKLGADIAANNIFQLLIPAGTIFGADVSDKNSFCLFGCVVNPGFDFKDFEIVSREELMKQIPQQIDLINRLTIK